MNLTQGIGRRGLTVRYDEHVSDRAAKRGIGAKPRYGPTIASMTYVACSLVDWCKHAEAGFKAVKARWKRCCQTGGLHYGGQGTKSLAITDITTHH